VLSAAALLFQFAQTRLFSATLGYHLSFLVLSGALLGVALGGTAAALIDDTPRRPRAHVLAIAAGVGVLLALLLNSQIDSRATGLLTATALAYVFSVPPLLLVSWVIVRSLRESPRATGAIYAADLAGAAVGGLLGYGLLGPIGDQGLHGLAAGLCLCAAGLLHRGGTAALRTRAVLLVLATVAVLTLGAWGETIAPPRPGPLKFVGAYLESGAARDYAYWDALARVDALRPPTGGTWSTGYPLHYAIDRPADRPMSLFLDMGAETLILKDGQRGDLKVLDQSILSAPYELAGRASALIIGPGGGIDLNIALHKGMARVSAVEVNRAVAEVMRTRYASFGGDVYSDPRATVVVDEARSFIRRSTEQYDVMVMTVVDSGAALQSGTYALSENYLYTEEAIADYVRHLTPGGVVAIGRWYPLEVQRTYQIALAGLRRLGHERPDDQVAILRDGNFGLVLIGQRAFSVAEIARLKDFAAFRGFDVVSSEVRTAWASLPDAPSTDDRPFFFDIVPIAAALAGEADLSPGYAILLIAFVLAAMLAIPGALMPLYRAARERSGSVVPRGTTTALLLGVGFIASELVVLQRLTLYLGQPSLALAIGIAAILGGAAIGSSATTRLPIGVRGAATASAAILTIVLIALPIVTDATLAAPLPIRAIVAILAGAAVGVPLGTVFPKLITAVSERGASLVSWVWAMNGTASVLGAIAGTAVALVAGFTALGVVAVGCYVVAALVQSRYAVS
jgi:hypothetical protein